VLAGLGVGKAAVEATITSAMAAGTGAGDGPDGQEAPESA